jgi:hypothetical protein
MAFGFLVLLASSCQVERYPLAVLSGRTYLEGRDRTGALVRFAIDTGSDRSFLSRSWLYQVGAQVAPGPPGAWVGVRLATRWRSVAYKVPVPQGVPRFLEGLPAADDGPLSPLAGPVPTVGLLGTDLLWDWSLDFRSEVPWLVHGSVDAGATGRPRFILFQEGGRYSIGFTAWSNGTASLSGRAVVDTGSPFTLLLFQNEPPFGIETVTNSRSPVTANGTSTLFFGIDEIRIGRASLGPAVGLVGQLDGPNVILLGTPALRAFGAVFDLKDWSLSLNRVNGPVRENDASPEAWGWSATVVAGRGIRLDRVLVDSVLGQKGLRTGDWVTKIGDESAAAPRSSLEWKRTWIEVGLGRF